MAGQSLVSDEAHSRTGKSDGQQHLEESGEIGKVILRLIEDAVSQSGTRKNAEEAVEE